MMKTTLKTFLKSPIHLFYRFKARSALTQLTSHEYSKLNAVGYALLESLDKTFSDQERQVIASIEQRRSFLMGSDKQIAVVDYGAGSPNSRRTVDEMKKGVPATASVSSLCMASKPAFWATFLFKLIRKLEPTSCVELGSCVGISASYQAAALQFNGRGMLRTLEGSPAIAKIAQETLQGVNLSNAAVVTGPFHETLKGVLESAKPIDFFFNDGHHDHDAVIEYFNEALPYFAEGAAIVFDDISWSAGMRRAWIEIEKDERVAASVDFHTIGLAFVSKKMVKKVKFRIPL